MNKEIRQALFAKITGEPAVTSLLSDPNAVFDDVADNEAEYPLVVISKSSGRDVQAFTKRAFRTQLWIVKAVVTDTTSDPADDIDAALNTLLDRASLTITNSLLLGLWRESDIGMLEEKNGEQYRHAGGLYRLIAQ